MCASVSSRRFALAQPAIPIQHSPPVLDVQEVLKRLPAEARAELAWTARPIETGLLRLRQEALTDALVDEVMESLITALLALGQAVRKWLVANLDELVALWMQDLRSREERLTDFLVDEDSRDTLRWVLGWLRSFHKPIHGYPVSGRPPGRDDDAGRATGQDADFRSLYTGLVCFMAASEEARLGASRERAQDLLDVAFLELHRLSREVRDVGLWVTAFPDETLEERRSRLLRDAERLRRSLGESDWLTIESARLQALR